VALWTQRLQIRWHQNIAFYEARYEILRAFEDAGLLRRFRREDNRVVVRIGAAHQVIGFGANGLTMALLTPESDEVVVRQAASIVWDRLTPAVVGGLSLGLQFLSPIEMPYDDAKSKAASALVGSDVGAAVPQDFALLYDANDRELDGTVRLEIGVIDDAEVPVRLARSVGRVGSADKETPPSLWQGSTLPAVALFCDQDWDVNLGDVESLDGVFARLEATRRAADELMVGFAQRLDIVESTS
jgi:hypothetical protein